MKCRSYLSHTKTKRIRINYTYTFVVFLYIFLTNLYVKLTHSHSIINCLYYYTNLEIYHVFKSFIQNYENIHQQYQKYIIHKAQRQIIPHKKICYQKHLYCVNSNKNTVTCYHLSHSSLISFVNNSFVFSLWQNKGFQ